MPPTRKSRRLRRNGGGTWRYRMSAPDQSRPHPPLGEGSQQCGLDRRRVRQAAGPRRPLVDDDRARARGLRGPPRSALATARRPSPQSDPLRRRHARRLASRGAGPWMTLANVAWLGAGAAIPAAEGKPIVPALITLTLVWQTHPLPGKGVPLPI